MIRHYSDNSPGPPWEPRTKPRRGQALGAHQRSLNGSHLRCPCRLGLATTAPRWDRGVLENPGSSASCRLRANRNWKKGFWLQCARVERPPSNVLNTDADEVFPPCR